MRNRIDLLTNVAAQFNGLAESNRLAISHIALQNQSNAHTLGQLLRSSNATLARLTDRGQDALGWVGMAGAAVALSLLNIILVYYYGTRTRDEFVFLRTEVDAYFQKSRGGSDGADLARLADDFGKLTREAGAVLESKLSSASFAPVTQQVEKLSQTIEELGQRMAGVTETLNRLGTTSQELARQLEEKRDLEGRETKLKEQYASRERELENRQKALENELSQRAAALDGPVREREVEVARQEKVLAEKAAALRTQSADSERVNAERESVLWPEAFRNGGPLGQWRERILTAACRRDELARAVMLHIIKAEALCSRKNPPLPEVAELFYNLSLEAHQLWKATPEDFIDSAILWRNQFNAILANRALPLEIQAVHPKDRFDGHFMVPAKGSTSSRLYVQEPLSWAILDKSNPQGTKVLHHAEVVTV